MGHNSSNINEVIRSVSNFLFYFIFFTKRFYTHKKHQKHQKHKKAPKSTKSTKKHKKHQKHKKYKKHENVNKRISDFFPLRYFLCA